MEKTIKINLGGILFHINEDASVLLRNYLQSLNESFRNLPEGNETIEDIELRIAEIFRSQKGPEEIVTKENVESAISVIGNPAEFEIPESADAYIPRRKRLFRNPDDRIISGVCGGIGAYLSIAPVWIRIFFIFITWFFGAGLVIYIALWIALPFARNEADKREMYGNARYSEKKLNQSPQITAFGNTFNEIFRGIGKLGFIFLRVLLVITGISFVLAGFFTLVTFVIVFIFKYPGAFSTNIDGVDLSYVPDFLNYVFFPPVAAWINILSAIIVILPLLCIIYWGIKMIFWLRVRDGIFNLTALVIWIISTAVLSVILLNEGINYSQPSENTISETISPSPDTLYIMQGKKMTDLRYDHKISIPDENYDIFLNEEMKDVFIRTYVSIEPAEDRNTIVRVTGRSRGRNRPVAQQRTEALLNNFLVRKDTIVIDEYFAYPPDMKWGFDDVITRINVPSGTVISTDIDPENFRNHDLRHSDNQNNGYWKMTGEGLEPVAR